MALAVIAVGWTTILRLILLIATGVSVGYTVYKYITTLEQPAVTQTFSAVAQLVPLMVTMMVFNLMMTITASMREMISLKSS